MDNREQESAVELEGVDPGSSDDLLDTGGAAQGTLEASGKSEVITDINELDMVTEPMEDVDEAKLEERMAFAPSIPPGKFYNFIFKLEKERPVQSVIKKGKTYAQFNYTATLLDEHNQPTRTVRFQRADNMRTGKMESSRSDELLFSLGKMGKFKETQRKASDIMALLQEAEGEERVFRGLIQWRHYDKETGVTHSTAPSKPYEKTNKDGSKTQVVEQEWPRDASGALERMTGGQEEITRVQPTKETLAEIHAAQQPTQQAA